jgi:hypothetical protein
MMITLPRALLLQLHIGCAITLSWYLGKTLGFMGYGLGFVLGLAGTFISYLLVLQVLRGLVVIIYSCPPCRQNVCTRFKDFAWKDGSFYGYEGWRVWRFKCRCGAQYLFDGVNFQDLNQDGSTRPYLKLIRFRTWKDVTSENGVVK